MKDAALLSIHNYANGQEQIQGTYAIRNHPLRGRDRILQHFTHPNTIAQRIPITSIRWFAPRVLITQLLTATVIDSKGSVVIDLPLSAAAVAAIVAIVAIVAIIVVECAAGADVVVIVD